MGLAFHRIRHAAEEASTAPAGVLRAAAELTVPPQYLLERQGPWWFVVGPGGVKVGKGRRSKAEAQAALDLMPRA